MSITMTWPWFMNNLNGLKFSWHKLAGLAVIIAVIIAVITVSRFPQFSGQVLTTGHALTTVTLILFNTEIKDTNIGTLLIYSYSGTIFYLFVLPNLT